jgi:hypothetical protein
VDVEFQPSPALAGLLDVLRAAVNGAVPAAPAEWPAVLAQAHAHGVEAYLYPVVRAWPADRRPDAAQLAAWRLRFLSAAAEAERGGRQVDDLLARLAEADVPAMPLKGAWLARHVYPEPACRPMADIDLLVPRASVEAADGVFRAAGYTGGGAILSERFIMEHAYRHPEGGRPVEMHWRFVSDVLPGLPEPDPGELWRVSAAGGGVWRLPPADHLLLVAHHALHHRLGLPLRAWLDLVLLARHVAAAGGGALEAAARRWRLGRAAPAVLDAAAALLRAPCPPPLDAWTAGADPAGREQAVALALAWAAEQPPSAGATLAQFQERRGWSRLRLAAGRVCMPRDFMRQHYRCARRAAGLPFAYLRRVWDLAAAHGRDACRAFWPETQTARALRHLAARGRLVRKWLEEDG